MKGKIKEIMDDDDFSDEIPEPKVNKILKLNNQNSMFKNSKPLPDIRQHAMRILQDEEEQKRIAVELTQRLLAVLRDKTLDENKTQFERDEERAIITEYAQFARLINSDQTKEEGDGSLVFINAIARCLLLQRDRINELEYKLIALNKQLIENKPNK